MGRPVHALASRVRMRVELPKTRDASRVRVRVEVRKTRDASRACARRGVENSGCAMRGTTSSLKRRRAGNDSSPVGY